VDPYGLGFARGAWYLVGYDHTRTALRSFRLDRIRGEVAPFGPERAFRPPDSFRVQDHVERPPWEMAEAPPIEVTIEVAPAIAWFVEDLVAGKRPAEHRADGSALLRLDVRDRAAFVRWVLSHGRHVRIKEPRDLRDELLATIRALDERHAAPPSRAQARTGAS
ncbi:MAG: helix-turn-helix transcriptional regulator, partial [Polyangiaceae bacterium]